MKTLADQRCHTELTRRIATLRADSARRWGVMSVHQMVCHLNDSCRMAIGQKTVQDVSTLAQRTLVKFMALYLPLRWPPGLPTRPEIDSRCSGTKPSEFAADVAELERLLDTFVRDSRATWPPHPIFGRMTRAAWLRWGYLHTDHHLRQFGA